MMVILNKLKRCFWVLFGEWFVLYAPGKYSVNMTYTTAKGYKEMFGGEVHPSYQRYSV